MHEFSIAQSLLETALSEASNHKGKRIRALVVKLGRESHVEPDSLEFCLRAVARETIAKEARIEIESLEPTARYRECTYTFSTKDCELSCPSCGGKNLEMVAGSEVFLESLEVD